MTRYSIHLVGSLLILMLIGLTQCKEIPQESSPIDIPPSALKFLESSSQRTGDAEEGRAYLLNGDYVDSGIPLDIFTAVYPNPDYDLNREGINEGIDHTFNAFISENGVAVAAPNCLQCHASELDGNLILGLGNTMADFTTDQGGINTIVSQLIINTYGANSPEYEAYEPFAQAIEVTGSELKTETIGSNPADKIAALLAAHRDPVTLQWLEEDQLGVPEEVIPTDVPPWWNLKKKNAMFYAGVGRGDFARISMASSILTLKDTIKAREVDENFANVIAYINTLTPPPYSADVDTDLANEGSLIFNQHCSSCHGTYVDDSSYPNLLVDLDFVKTDSALIYANFGFNRFTDWYNDSWFGQEPHAAQLVPERGYVAPPLDGIWASAPYLHNGSVPDLRSLLDSETRPSIWRRVGEDYNHNNVGWEYISKASKEDKFDYDTSLLGYGNGGHTFGDHLTESERNALLEYLKII